MNPQRASVARRLANLLSRLRWLSPLAGGFIPALWLILRMRSAPDDLHRIAFAGRTIVFRGADVMVLREVLADQEYSFLAPFLERIPLPRILDVGAHIGTFAAVCRSYAPGAQVLSVEADPDTFEVLQLNSQAWGGTKGGWQVAHAAAGAEDGVLLRLDTAGPTMSHRVSPTGQVDVRSLGLSSLVARCAADTGMVDLAKIDIEGSEEAFICAAPEVLHRIRAIVVELHPSLCDVDRVRKTLQAYFPAIREIGGRVSSKPLLFCQRN